MTYSKVRLRGFLFLLLIAISCNMLTILATQETKIQENVATQNNKPSFNVRNMIAAAAVVYLLGVVYCYIPKDYSKVAYITVHAGKFRYCLKADGVIKGVKASLAASDAEGVPAISQSIYAVCSNPWTWGLTEKLSSSYFLDSETIKDVMKDNQTRVLKMIVRSPSQ